MMNLLPGLVGMTGTIGSEPFDASNHGSTHAVSASVLPMPKADEGADAKRSPGFKNTLTLSELIEKLVARDAQDKDRAHAALALQYLSLNVDKVSTPCVPKHRFTIFNDLCLFCI